MRCPPELRTERGCRQLQAGSLCSLEFAHTATNQFALAPTGVTCPIFYRGVGRDRGVGRGLGVILGVAVGVGVTVGVGVGVPAGAVKA